MKNPRGRKRQRGRPPIGPEGQRARDFPALLVRLPPDHRETLRAVAEAKKWSQARVLREALEVYLFKLRRRELHVLQRAQQILESRHKAARENHNGEA